MATFSRLMLLTGRLAYKHPVTMLSLKHHAGQTTQPIDCRTDGSPRMVHHFGGNRIDSIRWHPYAG